MRNTLFRLLPRLKIQMDTVNKSSEYVSSAKFINAENADDRLKEASISFYADVKCGASSKWNEKSEQDMQLGIKKIPFQKVAFKELNSGKLHLTLTDMWQKRSQVFRFRLFGKNMIVLNKADDIEKVLRHNTKSSSGRLPPFFQQYIFNGHGFSFGDLTKISERQKSVVWEFLKSQHKTFDIRTEVSELNRSLIGEEYIENMDDRLESFLHDLFVKLLIGETLPEDDPDRNALWELVNQLYIMLEPSVDLPLRMFPFLRHLPGRHGRVFRKAIEARDKVSKQFFESQKTTYEEGRVRGLVDVCLQIQADEIREKGETWLTDDYIRGIMYDTVAAGMTEMMKSLRMLVLLMCHYPDVQSRVQAEIDDVIGKDFPNASHQKEMPYTQAVIFEMLRYVSQTPLAIPHKSNKDIMLNGYLIEKDSGIFPNIWGIHHDEDVWGDPWVFRPDRFLDENNELISKQHKTMKSFIPFSVGKRRCPGENFAMSRIFVIFAALLQKIHFAGPEGQELPSVDPRLYTNKYPMVLPIYTCRALHREPTVSS